MTSQNRNPAAIIDRLERFIETFPAIVSAFHPDDIAWKPDSESWSVLEIVCHMADEEAEDFPVRVFLTLNDPSLDWPPIDPEGWAISRDYLAQDHQTELSRWITLRKQNIKALRALKNPDWSSTKTHYQFGPMVAIDLLAAWSAHDALHLRQLAKRLHQLASRDAGHDSTTRYAGDW